MNAFLNMIWYKRHPLRWLLLPASLCFQLVAMLRRNLLQRLVQKPLPVPVITVGNLTVGGTGKTPLVIALAKALTKRGIRVGIVSRGYGGSLSKSLCDVSIDTSPRDVGDEPLLIAQKTNCPVVIARKRTQAVDYLVTNYQSQIILSDDGLQHYAMGRSMEIVVVDGMRGLGNQLCLPAGPLREGVKRLKSVDFIVVNGGTWPNAHRMELDVQAMKQLRTNKPVEIHSLKGGVAAVAAIGHPQRFFNTLTMLGISYQAYPFPDHHCFLEKELQFVEKTIVMTEKDAVKCRSFATDSMYVLSVEARLDEAFWQAFWSHPSITASGLL